MGDQLVAADVARRKGYHLQGKKAVVSYNELVGVCSGYMMPVSETSYRLSENADTILSPNSQNTSVSTSGQKIQSSILFIANLTRYSLTFLNTSVNDCHQTDDTDICVVP
jgi:hypothetical protein